MSIKQSQCELIAKVNGVFNINDNNIKGVTNFCYFDRILTSTGGSSMDMDAKQEFCQLTTVWTPESLSTNTKVRIFNPNVLSVPLYGCEAWNTVKREF